jgi:hypothetical protein
MQKFKKQMSAEELAATKKVDHDFMEQYGLAENLTKEEKKVAEKE